MSSVDNIRPYQFKPGQSGNPSGRRKSLAKVTKEIPADEEKKVYLVLWKAIKSKSVAEATMAIEEKAATDFEYGFVYQIAIRELAGPNGFRAMMDILDRLFGKP